MPEPKIIFRDFNFYYNYGKAEAKHAVRGLNLNIAERMITAVIGPANSGVTTMLRSVNRLSDLIPGVKTEGEILLDGANVLSAGVNVTSLRRRAGMVFDIPTSLPMSIFDNVAYGPRLGGVKNKNELNKVVEESLKMAALWDDVKDRLKTPAQSLSGGQQQRLCMARVIALEPEVILLDRPCSGLDPVSTSKIEDSLSELKKRYTIIIAPHNVQQASRISDRTVFMLTGKLIEEGESLKIFSNPDNKLTDDYVTGRFG